MNYLHWSPFYSSETLLIDAYNDMQNYSLAKANTIPFIIQLFENPKYDFIRFGRLPGSIDLFKHDLLHILLNQDMSMHGEAYVIGYTMGSTKRVTAIDIIVFKLISRFIYPKNYKFDSHALSFFDTGIEDGYSSNAMDLNKVNFNRLLNKPLYEVRSLLKILP